MHSDAFDRYHHRHSLLHHLDPRLKVVVTVTFILSNALLPDGAWITFALAWLFLLMLNAVSRLGPGFTFRRSFVALPFALAAVTVLFLPQGDPLGAFHFLRGGLGLQRCKLITTVSDCTRYCRLGDSNLFCGGWNTCASNHKDRSSSDNR